MSATHLRCLRLCFCLLALLAGFAPDSARAARRILFMGDSFSKGAFGKTLDAQLRAAGFELFTSVTGGASAYDWLPEFGSTSCDIGYWEKTPRSEKRVSYIARVPKLDDLVESFRPDVVVIQGGTNMYSVLTSKRRSRDANVAEFERLLDRMGEITRASGARLYWVTPATAHPERFSTELQAEMKSTLEKVVGKYGRVFDSYAVTRFTDPYPGTDGIHYGPTESAAWARLVARDVIAYAGGPARLDRPQEPRANRGDRRGDGNVPPQPRERRSFWDIFKRDKTAAGETGSAPSPPAAITIRRAELVRQPSLASQPAAAGDVIEVEVSLRQKSAARTLNEITYRSALGVYEYDVLQVLRGNYPHPRIRIAHLIVMNNRYTAIHHRPLGSRMSLAVEPLSKYPNLEKVQTIDDLPEDFSLPVFVPKL